ncbi:hypothetical protein CSUI_001473 [Cystoisospora suis]|uniref:Uncharacterized protein n=1 Tax=Cystoisospora suis TaxID=483139 RepID=A0A2C6LCU6_9APIC|nr:hypothetical protein CSUI_001473 [Cystoisospora suis]
MEALRFSIVLLLLAAPIVARCETSSQIVDSEDLMMEQEEMSIQEVHEMSEDMTSSPLRYLEEEESSEGMYIVPETFTPLRSLGKKNRAVYVAAPAKYVAPAVHKKAAAPIQYVQAPLKYTPAISKKGRRLAAEMPVEEEMSTISVDSELDGDRDLHRTRGYYVAYTPYAYAPYVHASPYCAMGSSCARYLNTEVDSEDVSEGLIESAPERSMGRKSRAVYTAPMPKTYVPAPAHKKAAAPVYRPATVVQKSTPVHKSTPVTKKSPPVVHKKSAPTPRSKVYQPAVTHTSSKYMPSVSKKGRRLAEEAVSEEEATISEGETEQEERELKKRAAYYYPVYPVVAAPYCSKGTGCY